jgi:DoxX-like family
MNQRLGNMIAGLRWSLGLVVLYESCLLAFEPGRIRAFEHAGLPHLIRPVLAGGEILAAALFLVPFTNVMGSYFLLVIFAFAAAIHVLHGQYDVGELIVFSMAVWVSLAQRENQESRAVND